MPFDFTVLTDKAAEALTTGVVGLLGGFALSMIGLPRRVKALELLVATSTEERAEELQLLKSSDAVLSAHVDVVASKLEDQLRELRADLEKIESVQDNLRDSSHDFAKEAELTMFIEEQRRQWLKVQRTLGQIEGVLHTLK